MTGSVCRRTSGGRCFRTGGGPASSRAVLSLATDPLRAIVLRVTSAARAGHLLLTEPPGLHTSVNSSSRGTMSSAAKSRMVIADTSGRKKGQGDGTVPEHQPDWVWDTCKCCIRARTRASADRDGRNEQI